MSAVSCDLEVNTTHESQQQNVSFTAFDPPAVEANFVQQQQDFDASSAPQISNYFDGGNESSFDIPHQQQTRFYQELAQAPPPQVEFHHPPVQQNITQQYFQTPVAAAQNVPHEQFSFSPSHELQLQLNQQNHQITQLKSELDFHRTTALNLQKNTEELNRLKQESHSHVDVVKVLVAEKSHLMDTLQKSELMVKAKFDENEELQNRLNASRHRVKQLESEVNKPFNDHALQTAQTNQLVEIAAKTKELRESHERTELEKNELKILLNQKRIEMENLQKNFDHLNTELHLANVKIEQLSDGTPPTDEPNQSQLHMMSQEVAIRQQQITELYSIIDQVNRDKEASDNQYQNYVSHLTREMEALKESSIELSNENDSFVRREQELLKHVSDLERQIQQQIQKQKTYADDQKDQTQLSPSQEELQKASSRITALTESNQTLKSKLEEVEAKKAELGQHLMLKTEETTNLELRMDQLKSDTPNLSQLMTDFEDKSVAASRALSQNQALKDQLDEMQRAFITMTNDKMELTDKLSSEVHLCKEMKVRYDSMDIELQEMKDKWHYKEDEMIRLSHENTELEKKIFQQNIEIDRLRHYESKEYHGTEGVLEKELDNYKRMIEMLTNKINILESKGSDQHDHSHEGGHGHSHSHESGHQHEQPESKETEHNHHDNATKRHLLDEIEMLKMEKNELLKAMSDFQMSKKSTNADKSADEQEIIMNGNGKTPEMNEEMLHKLSVPKSVTPSMATEEALEKLQARFRRTMLEVAELSEEKQRLEHVVTQLQFETETIGEYITLYQYQRRMLKQKEHERDIQLKNLSADREKMNDKLVQLNGLIEKFVMQHTDNVELAREATKFLEGQEHDSTPLITKPLHQSENMLKLKQETAGKILEILSDIKTANSITYDSNVSVEHCSCCLGKLETV